MRNEDEAGNELLKDINELNKELNSILDKKQGKTMDLKEIFHVNHVFLIQSFFSLTLVYLNK